MTEEADRDQAASVFGGMIAYWTDDAAPVHHARNVTENEDGMWAVSHSSFTTTDPALALAVATELDRIDPLT